MNEKIDFLNQLIDKILLNDKEKINEKEFGQYRKYIEMSAFENDLINSKIDYIAGVDEAGRGPLAGPVVAAAVILPIDFYLPGLDDSKKLSVKKRERFFKEIICSAISYGIGVSTVSEIDEINIYNSSKLAMERAIKALTIKPQHLLIDAMKLNIDIPQTSIIKGDAKSISIAAASVLAKVSRDFYMQKLDKQFPNYYFSKNNGYGTKQHIEAIKQHGIIDDHRKSFEPIKSIVNKTNTLFDL